MECNDDGSDEEPEQRMQSSKSVPGSVKFKDMTFMSGSFTNLIKNCYHVSNIDDLIYLHDMDCVLQIIHVFIICGNIEDRRDRFRQFDWKLDGIWTQFDWRVQTSSVAGVVVLVLLVQGQEHGGLVVLHHVDADVDVGLVTVVHPAYRQISM